MIPFWAGKCSLHSDAHEMGLARRRKLNESDPSIKGQGPVSFTTKVNKRTNNIYRNSNGLKLTQGPTNLQTSNSVAEAWYLFLDCDICLLVYIRITHESDFICF